MVLYQVWLFVLKFAKNDLCYFIFKGDRKSLDEVRYWRESSPKRLGLSIRERFSQDKDTISLGSSKPKQLTSLNP